MKKTTIVIFVSFLTLFMFFNLATPSSSFSVIENRPLQTFPVFSFERLINGSFTKQLETYASDQFFLRNQWIEGKTRVEQLLLKVEHHGVYFGQDDYLIERFVDYSDTQATRNTNRLKAFLTAEHAFSTHVMLVPTAVSIIQDKLPRTSFDLDQVAIIQKTLAPFNEQSIDIILALKETSDPFYKTDHHWNVDGAYQAYLILAKSYGFTPLDKQAFHIEVVGQSFQGSLFSKSGMFWHEGEDLVRMHHPSHDNIDLTIGNQVYHSIYFEEYLSQKDQYMYFMGGNHPIATIDTHHDGKKIMIVKDSFANILIPFLIPHFSQIVVVDVRFINQTVSMIADQYQVDDVLVLYSLNQFLNEFHLALLQ